MNCKGIQHFVFSQSFLDFYFCSFCKIINIMLNKVFLHQSSIPHSAFRIPHFQKIFIAITAQASASAKA